MKNLSFLASFLVINLNIIAQNSFRDFINLFPDYKWDSIPEDIRDTKKGNLLDIDKANEYIWGDDHTDIQIMAKGAKYKTPAPHFINVDGSYGKGEEGMFSKSTFCRDTGAKSELKAICKVNISSNIVLLIMYYRFCDLEAGWLEFYEAYTMRLNDEQLISSLSLWASNKLCVSYKKPDKSYKLYEKQSLGTLTEDGELEKTINKTNYKLRSDGYFQQTESKDVLKSGEIFYAKINDKDGWANVREQPNVNSPVLFKALNQYEVLVEKSDTSDWYKVILFAEFHKGFIHKSRLIKLNK